MKINMSLMDELKRLALCSGTHPKVWVSSALVYRGKVISFGFNQMKTHPFQLKYSKNNQCVFWHAETFAIFNAVKKINFERFDKSVLYVARMKYKNTEKKDFVGGIAAPCSGCMRCIEDFGIKNVIYTLDQDVNAKEQYGVMIL